MEVCINLNYLNMQTVQFLQITPNELVSLISEQFREQFREFSQASNTKTDKPHLTRKETAQYFAVSVGCINDWCNKKILTPYKVGQRTYFKRSELVQVMFNQKTA